MKKFTSLMMVLLCAITTSWAGVTDLPQITTDLENPIYYTISNTRSTSGRLIYYDASGIKDATPKKLEDKYKFFFTGTSMTDLKIHNAAAGELLFAGTGAWTAEGTTVKIEVTPHSSAAGLAIGFNGTYLNEANYGNGYVTYGANDGGSIFVIELATAGWPESEKYYTIECPMFFNVQGVSKGLYVKEDGSLGWNTVDLTNNNFYWVPTFDEEGNIALKNVGTEKYLNGTTMSESEVFGYLSPFGQQQQFKIIVNGTTVHANGHGNGANASGNIVTWDDAVNSGSAWAFIERKDPSSVQEVTVNYSFKYNGDEKYTQSTKTIIGEEYPAITISLPYGVSATVPTGEIEEDDAVEGVVTKEITLNIELPFEPAETAQDIKKWYYMQMHWNNPHYVNANGTAIEWKNATVDTENIDKYTWGFVGNPFDGIKVINYAAYNEENNDNTTLTWNSVTFTSLGTFDSATTFPIVHTSWSTAPSTSFCLQVSAGNYLNAQGTTVKSWSATDAGSTIWVTERDLSGATELQALIDAINAKSYEVGTTVGYIESLEALNTAITNAEAAVASKTGCIEAQAALQAAEDALETIQPEVDKFYTIKNCYSGVYMNVDNTTTMKIADTAAMGEVFQFVAAGDNKFYLYNVERGTYLNTAKGHAGGVENAAATSTENAKAVTIKNLGVEDRVSITPNGGAPMHHDATYANVVGWNGDANSRSAWKIEEVDVTTLAHSVTVSEAGYATLYLNYAVTIPEGVKVYGVTEATNGWAMMEEITGTIPANTGVILENAGTFAFNYSNNAGEGTSILKGTLLDENREEDAYVLGIANEKVGMYLAAKNQAENTAFKNNAFKAYLVPEVKENIASYSFNFDWNGTTGIENIEDAVEENATKAIYDITGRQIKAITVPGIYIINGKKTFVK